MRAMIFALGLALTGCGDSSISGGGPAVGDISGSAVQAYFTTYPERLFSVAAELCNEPGQTVVRAGRDEVRCESLPNPESAATIILQFDGSVEDLPALVISFAGRATDQGYLVTLDNYIRVPQRSGAVQLVRFGDDAVRADLADLLQSSGGRPL